MSSGGPIMWVIFFTACIAMVMLIWESLRGLALMKNARLEYQRMRSDSDYLPPESDSSSPIAQLLITMNWPEIQSKEDIVKEFNIHLAEITPKMEGSLATIAILGSLLPMLGLLGTVTGTLITLSLLLSITLLTNYRSHTTEQHPLLVVDLMAWPMPAKQEKPDPAAKPKQQPAVEKPVAKKIPLPAVPKPAPIAKRVVKERPLEAVEPVLMDEIVTDSKKATETTPSKSPPPTATKPMKNSMPTPVPIFQLTQGLPSTPTSRSQMANLTPNAEIV